jgi:Tfp pilus assembly protein PilX
MVLPVRVLKSRARRAIEKTFSGSRGDDGFALVIVLALMVLLAMVSAILANAVKAHIRSAASFQAETNVRALAESAVAAVMMDLKRNTSKLSARTAQATHREPVLCTFGNRSLVAVRIIDPAGRVDLNAASPALLQALMIGLGADAGSAKGITKSIEERRASWAKTNVARRAKFDPPPQPFETEEAIRQVDGVTPRLANAMLPYTTVYSGLSGIDPSAAEPELLDLLAADAGSALAPNMVGNSSRLSYIITIGVRSAAGGSYGLETVMRATGDKRFPMGMEIRSWRPAIAVGKLMPQPTSDAPSCLTDGLFSTN